MNTIDIRKAAFCLISVLAASPAYGQQEIQIPRSMSGDKGKYYLIELKKTGDIVTAIHKRVGVDIIRYTKTETNCKTMQMRELGYSEEMANKYQAEPDQMVRSCPWLQQE